jgi:hypothetical protein
MSAIVATFWPVHRDRRDHVLWRGVDVIGVDIVSIDRE